MKEILIAVKNKIAMNLVNATYVCDNSDYRVVFDFDGEWEEHPVKTARFKYNGQYQEVVFTGNECPVPLIRDARLISIGVYAGNLQTSTPAVVHASHSILSGDPAHDEPEEDVYHQLVKLVESGVLQGPGGKSAYELAVENGYAGTETDWLASLHGAPGKTPEYGVDYGTPEQIEDISNRAAIILADDIQKISDGKVDKVDGMGLSSNDYDNTAKAKVNAIPEDPKYTDTVYDDTEVNRSLNQLKDDLSELEDNVYIKKTELLTMYPIQGYPSGTEDTETTSHDIRISNEYPVRVKANDTIKLIDDNYKFAVYFKAYSSAEKTSFIWATSGWKTSDAIVSDCILNDYAIENGCVDIRVTICKVDNTETVATSIRMCDVVSISEEFKIQENDLSTEVRTKLNRGNVSNSVKFAHLSFDDVRYCMEDITNNAASYNSLFDNPFFAMLKNLHDTYGTVISLYLFTTEIGTFTDKFKDEFEANSDWLKFGLHLEGYAGNYSATTASNAKADYDRFTNGIVRITGTTECIDKCPRLSNFAGNLESCLAMRDANGGCVGFLSAYDDRQSYYLSAEDSAYVFNHGRLYDYANHLTFYRTLRSLETASVETILNPLLTLEGNNGSEYGIIMMHEYEVYNSYYSIVSEMVQRLQDASVFMVNHGYAWEYPMNKIIN